MKKALIAASLFTLSGSAFAIDGTIQFTGSFTDSPCVVTIDGTATNSGTTANVALGTWNIANFKTVKATTDLKPIVINLSSCPNMGKANIQFNGTADSNNSNLFATLTGPDAATNVGIGLYRTANNNDFISPNKRDLSIPLTSNTGQYTIYASYMTTGTTVTQGAANADVTMDISYE